MVSSHLEEHVCVATLSWQVNLRADVRSLSDDVDERIREVLRMRRCESDPHLRVDQAERVEQIGEPGAITAPQLVQLSEPI